MRILFHITFLVLVAVAQAFSQSAATPLSLDDCLRLAQDAQSSISLARQEVQIARGQILRPQRARIEIHRQRGTGAEERFQQSTA